MVLPGELFHDLVLPVNDTSLPGDWRASVTLFYQANFLRVLILPGVLLQ